MARYRNAKTFLLAVFLIVTIAAAVLPTTASMAASVTATNYPPYRAWGVYIYAKGDTVADYTSSWMEVHAQLWEKESDQWYMRVEKVNGGENISSITSTARMTHAGGGHFRTITFHEWNRPNGSYDALWIYSCELDV